MGQTESGREKDEEIKGIIAVVHKIADSIGSGNADFSVMDNELFTALLEAGYGIDEEKPDESNTMLVCRYLELYREIVGEQSERSRRLLRDLLYVLAENINYVYQKNSKWVELLKEATQLKPVEKLYNVHEIFLQQNGSDGAYGRWDTVVRYLAIEDYFGKNDYGFRLYRKMQAARQGEHYPEYAEVTFRKLIQSFEKNGYDTDSGITCDANLRLMDGSHRMALCLYYGIPEVKVTVLRRDSNIKYGEGWFWENGFTEEEIALIRNKCKELVAQCRQSFTCILWPPAAPYFDEIVNEISNMYPVLSQEEYVYSEETFARLVWGVYHIDDIEDWKVEKKLSYMAAAQPKKVRVVKVAIDAPNFRLKAATNQTLSQAGEQLKSTIRAKFMDRIENYFYDIIIHTGDNFKQNIYMEKLFKPAFSLSEYFAEISEYSYYIMKKDAPYQTPDFPKSYAFSKDLDIVCGKEDFAVIVQTTKRFLTERTDGYELVEYNEENNYRIRVELAGYLIFQFDISAGVPGLTEEFASESLANRRCEEGYYLPQMQDELCIRAEAYRKNPRKKHHLAYIKEHIVDWNLAKAERAMEHAALLPDELKNI